MTAKQFFKSVTFKCLITLLCVLLVSGVFLTVMNSLLKVTDEEKFARAINKIYGKSVTTEKVAVAQYNSDATIDEAYKVLDDGNYLIKATGKGGFDNGTVTCWVVVVVERGQVSGIGKVVIDSNKAQSYIGNINDKFLNGFSNYTGTKFDPEVGFVKTGATFSAGAICNAVNASIDYVNSHWLGNVTEDKFEGFLFREYIDTDATDYTTDENGNVVFSIKTKKYPEAGSFTINIVVGADGCITSYEIVVNGSTGGYEGKMNPSILDGTLFVGKDIAGIKALLNDGITYPSGSNSDVSTGATKSNYLCVCAAAFATANYKLATDLEEVEVSFEGCEYTTYIDTDATTVQLNKKTGAVVFNVVTTGASYEGANNKAKPFTIKITIDSTGVITAYEIVTNGSTGTSWSDRMSEEIKDGSLFVGKDIEGILAILDGGVEYPGDKVEGPVISTGATQSNHQCLYAAAFAAENYKLAGGQE